MRQHCGPEFALAVPGIRIGVFSTGSRASGGLQTVAMKVLLNIMRADPTQKNRLVRLVTSASQMCMVLSHTDYSAGAAGVTASSVAARRSDSKARLLDPNNSQIDFYPDATTTARGVHGTIFVLEEGAHARLKLMQEVIAPYLNLDGFRLLRISTALNESNWYSKLCRSPYFNTIMFPLACDACVAANKADNCPHMKIDQAEWKTDQHPVLREIMTREQLEAEQWGRIVREQDFVFRPEMINRAVDARRVNVTVMNPSVIYMFVDPLSTGSMSDLQILSAFQYQDNLVVSFVSGEGEEEGGGSISPPSRVAFSPERAGHPAKMVANRRGCTGPR